MTNYRKYFDETLADYFPDEYGEIISAVDSHYVEISPDIAFIKTSRNPIDRRLDFSACFLALIKTLDRRGEPFPRIREICLAVVTAYVRPKNRLHSFLKRLPPRFLNTRVARFIIKRLDKRIKDPNLHGFVARIVTDPQDTYGLGYGVDILECGICKLFGKHNALRYASILCEVDEITSGLAGLQLIRHGTIANGASKCDFRFKRATS